MTLIHLVGDRPLRNLLPLLLFRPARVIQVCSAPVRFAEKAERIEAAVADYLARLPKDERFEARFERIFLASELPGIEETRAAVGTALEGVASGSALVNFSEATKPMAIGAYLAAADQSAASFHFDTATLSLNDTGTCPLPPRTSLEDIAARLHVSTLVAAQGDSACHWHSEEPTARLLDFGEHAYPLWREHHDELWAFCEDLLRPLFRPEGRLVSGPELESALDAPLLAPPGSGTARYLDTAAASGILLRSDEGAGAGAAFRFALPPGLNRDDKRNAVERMFNLIEGSWLELFCYKLLLDNPRYTDLQWSVTPDDADDAAYGETDLVCVDTRTLSLVVISCKSYLPRLEHCEALARRAATLGGPHAEAMLCATPWRGRDDHHTAARHRQAHALGVQLLCDEEIADYFAPL